jgi:hypothetical protein
MNAGNPTWYFQVQEFTVGGMRTTGQMGAGDPMTTNDLRDDILSALKRGAPHADLLKIVLRHKALGVSQCATYDAVQEIWIELGCADDEDEENPVCAPLGDLMDRVWGYCSARDAIWDSPLAETCD